MLHGPQEGLFDLQFRVPAECADMIASGAADIGIIPSFELLGRDLGVVPGVGIACRGAVRSILLVSKRPAGEIRTLAADASSRTSVALARIILARRYGAEPVVTKRPPNLAEMLHNADAALIIGDPALHLNPETLPFRVYDLGTEWMDLTGLPMVFAVWAGTKRHVTSQAIAALQDSCAFGLGHLQQIIELEAVPRGFAPELARRYLGSHIVFELGAIEQRGMELFLEYAGELAAKEEAPAAQSGSQARVV